MADAFDKSGDLLVIGGGRMGEALAAGLLARGWPSERLVVVEAADPRRAELADRHPGLRVAGSLDDGVEALSASGGDLGALIAVKPHDVTGVCEELARTRVRRVVSVAAGVSIWAIEAVLAEAVVLRVMPNTPALVGAAASVLAPGSRAGAADVAWARSILEAVGTVVELPESALDAVTGLSGSGPAYVFLVAEALIDAGVLAGLARPVARELAVQTLLGSARLLVETAEEPSALRAAVTSPGGTTAAGLRALEAGGVRAAILEAVMAAAGRSKELGQPH